MNEAVPGSAPGDRPPLDDIMLAMDVVDTLRRRERLISRELNDADRQADLLESLRRIYAEQGIDVPDHVIEQGVTALKEERFTYRPPPAGLATRLARLYVKRHSWGKWVGGGLGAGIVAFAANYFAFVAPQAALPDDLAASHAAVLAVAETEHARAVAEGLLNAGEAALGNHDNTSAKAAIAQLVQLRAQLEREYLVQIVNRPGERSGVWRIPDINTTARNYYIIVEALDPSGQRLILPIDNEETGKTEEVQTWGLRVDAETFEAVASDKQDDGIIQRDRFGYKKRGRLLPHYDLPTTGGAITAW
jgi:hypothetical protein